MTVKSWLLLLIASLTASAEVLLWAAVNGQFRDVNRGRWLPLRAAPAAPPRRDRRALAIVFAGIALCALIWGRLACHLLRTAF